MWLCQAVFLNDQRRFKLKDSKFPVSMGCNQMQLLFCKADVADMGDEKSYVEKAMADCI